MMFGKIVPVAVWKQISVPKRKTSEEIVVICCGRQRSPDKVMALGMEVANPDTEVESVGFDGRISRRKDSTCPKCWGSPGFSRHLLLSSPLWDSRTHCHGLTHPLMPATAESLPQP